MRPSLTKIAPKSPRLAQPLGGGCSQAGLMDGRLVAVRSAELRPPHQQRPADVVPSGLAATPSCPHATGISIIPTKLASNRLELLLLLVRPNSSHCPSLDTRFRTGCL